MENSNDLDYVTEKSFQAFEFGSVPIHLGSPSFNQSFQPAPNTAIDLADYLPAEYLKLSAPGDTPPAQLSPEGKAGMVRLADRLRHLGSAEGREDYERMLEWKKDEGWIESPLGKLVKLGRTELPSDCMLAGLVRGKEWGKSGWTPSSWYEPFLSFTPLHNWWLELILLVDVQDLNRCIQLRTIPSHPYHPYLSQFTRPIHLHRREP